MPLTNPQNKPLKRGKEKILRKEELYAIPASNRSRTWNFGKKKRKKTQSRGKKRVVPSAWPEAVALNLKARTGNRKTTATNINPPGGVLKERKNILTVPPSERPPLQGHNQTTRPKLGKKKSTKKIQKT